MISTSVCVEKIIVLALALIYNHMQFFCRNNFAKIRTYFSEKSDFSEFSMQIVRFYG